MEIRGVAVRQYFLVGLVVFALGSPIQAVAENLIADPSFENGVVHQCDQGYLPDTWFQVSTISPGADTYSFNCAIRTGLSPTAFNNFITLPSAHDGIRFVAGSDFLNDVYEGYGARLVSPLVQGAQYHVSAYFVIDDRRHAPGIAELYVSPTADLGSGVFIGRLGGNAVRSKWTRDELTFIAPAGYQYLLIRPRALTGVVNYLGSDDWQLILAESVSPRRGGNAGSVTLTIPGAELDPSAHVSLTAPGQSDIVAYRVTGSGSGRLLIATFDLTGQPVGIRDVIVINPDGSTHRYAAAFEIIAGGSAHVWAEVIGPSFFRYGAGETVRMYAISYGNSGEIDSVPVGLSVSFPQFMSATLPNAAGQVISGITEEGNHALTAYVPSIPPGQSGMISLRLSLPDPALISPHQLFELVAWVDPFPAGLSQVTSSTMEDVQLDAVILCPTLTANGQLCTGTTRECTVRDALASHGILVNKCPCDNACDGYCTSASGCGSCTSVASLATDVLDRLLALNFNCGVVLSGGSEGPSHGPGACAHCRGYSVDLQGTCVGQIVGGTPIGHPKGLPCADSYFNSQNCISSLDETKCAEPHWHLQFENCSPSERCGGRRLIIDPITAGDPNGKVGSAGSGDSHYISMQQPVRYSIFFENVATASAAAQQVVVTDSIDGTKLNLGSLRLGPIIVGNHVITPPPFSTQFSGDIDLRPDQDLIARITASLNSQTGVLTWRFASIDPATGEPTTDPLAGLLPPNVSPPAGQGSIYFELMPNQDIVSGSQIQNQATIVFDENAPIATNVWVNTIDTGTPTSQMHSSPETERAPSFQIGWSGTDADSGTKNFTIFSSDNGGPFRPFLRDSATTSATFLGESGHTYGFYSLAQDQAGNFESAKDQAEATTTVVPNRNPIANAGPDQVQECTGMAGAQVMLNGLGSSDPDADLLTYTWTGPFGTASGPTPNVTLPPGTHTITLTVDDGRGGNDSDTVEVVVVDTTPPTVTAISASPAFLWPPNHTMRDVSVEYTATDVCSAVTCALSVTSNEPDNGTGDGDTAPDWIIGDDHHLKLRAERAGTGPGRTYKTSLTCSDASANVALPATLPDVRVMQNMSNPKSGTAFRIGTSVEFTGSFWEVIGKTHTAQWMFDSLTTPAAIMEPTATKPGSVRGTYTFTSTGVYAVKMNVKDASGATGTADAVDGVNALVAIYDPDGGYVTGGGWLESPAGAYHANPSLAGKVSFGFVSKYLKNATNPKGETQFDFKLAGLSFNALNFDYLVISGAKVMYRGFGKINGNAGYSFILTVIDGQATNGGGVDKFRIKIWNKTTGAIVYDTQMGAPDNADPVTPVGEGSTIVIQP